jgi:hypothetical protein
MYTIRQILKDNWNDYKKAHQVKDYQIKEVEKMINCSKNSCNSRICSSCGKRYADDWSNGLKEFLPKTNHKHIVLTAPSFLRSILRNWYNLKILMDSSRDFLWGFLALSPWD